MGSSTHTPGVGSNVSLVGQRTLPSLLASHQQLAADNRFVVYVAPLGSGQHLVRNQCNDQAYRVGSSAGNTFTPGQIVIVGSHTGAPGEVIIGQPPPGLTGAAEFTVNATVRNGGPTPRVSGCPRPITGKSYLALYNDAGANRVLAWRYLDGSFVQDLGASTYPSGYSPRLDLASRLHPLGDKVGVPFIHPTAGWLALGQMSVGAPFGITEADFSGVLPVAFPLPYLLTLMVWGGGGYFFFALLSSEPMHSPPRSRLRLYRLPLSSSFLTYGEPAARVGLELVDTATPLVDVGFGGETLGLTRTASDWQAVFSLVGGGAIAPFFADGSSVWQSGRGRAPAWGGRALPTASGFAYNENGFVISPGPINSYYQAFPSSYDFSGGALSVNPAKIDAAHFPVLIGGYSGVDHLLRFAIPSAPFPDGCSLRIIVVEPGPNGQVPNAMLCRD